MSNGVLEFTLGLTTGGFVSSLGKANLALKGFLGGMIGLGAIGEGVWKQIEKGAELKKLSDQSGESAGKIFQLQKALKSIGADSGNAGHMLLMLQRSLGGMSETGEPTAHIFSQLGLSLQDLKRQGGPEVIAQLATRIGQLNASSATAASGKIFGRFGAAEFLQIARNSEEFAEALKQGAIQAAIFDRYAGAFHKFEITIGQVKNKLDSLFLGIAAGIVPGLNNVLNSLNSIDLSEIGRGLGTVLTAFTQAFREGKLSELIGDSLKLGFDSLLAYAPGIFEKIGYLLLKAFETPLNFFQAGMQYAMDQAANNPKLRKLLSFTTGGQTDILLGALGLGSGQTTSFADIMKEQKEKGVGFNFGAGEFGLGDINSDANSRLAAAQASMKDKWKDFWGEIGGFARRAHMPGSTSDAEKKDEQLGAVYKRSFTNLEKMGLVRGGAISAPTDHAKITAANTAKMAATLTKMDMKMTTRPAALTNSHA